MAAGETPVLPGRPAHRVLIWLWAPAVLGNPLRFKILFDAAALESRLVEIVLD